MATLDEFNENLPAVPKLISPGAHAVLDYSVASTYFAMWSRFKGTHRSAATLACINGSMVLALALLTNYPGGVFRTLSFKTHRTMDAVQAAVAGLGPVVMGFGNDPEAAGFYAQAASEIQAKQPIQRLYMRIFDGGLAANVLNIVPLTEGDFGTSRGCAQQPTATEVMQTPRTRSLYMPKLERPVFQRGPRTR